MPESARELLDELTLWGDADHARAALDRWYDGGAQMPSLTLPPNRPVEELDLMLEALAPVNAARPAEPRSAPRIGAMNNIRLTDQELELARHALAAYLTAFGHDEADTHQAIRSVLAKFDAAPDRGGRARGHGLNQGPDANDPRRRTKAHDRGHAWFTSAGSFCAADLAGCHSLRHS